VEIDVDKELKAAIEAHQAKLQELAAVQRKVQELMNDSLRLEGRIKYLDSLKNKPQ